MAYRSSRTESESLEVLIRASRLNKVMADKGKKSSMEIFAPNDKANYYSGITSITVNGKNAYELKGKFLDDLHNNAFSGTNEKDAVEHIEYYLKIIDPIKLHNVDHDKLRVVVFPISLAGGARRWFDKTKESITCWVDLTAMFLGNTTRLLALREITLPALWDYWKMGGDEIEVSDDESSDLKVNWVLLVVGERNVIVMEEIYHIGNSLHYQDLEWYEALEDSELKDEALKNKAIMEGLISDDESSQRMLEKVRYEP
ncbi:hypothetical protein Tco_1245148 [Tanacetum coccineum]